MVVKGAHVFGEAGDAFVADIGVAVSPAVRVSGGTPRAGFLGLIAELGDLRVFGATETVEAQGLTAVPLPATDVKEGDTVSLPPGASADCGGEEREADAAAAGRAPQHLARRAHHPLRWVDRSGWAVHGEMRHALQGHV